MAISAEQLPEILESIKGQLTEASTEIVAKIDDLTEQLGSVTLPEGTEDLLADISVLAQSLADIVPNEPVE